MARKNTQQTPPTGQLLHNDVGIMPNRKKRSRIQYKFWLNIADDLEYHIAEICEYTKTQRSFAKTIRDGIQLIYSLRNGDLSILLAMFPWVKEALQPPPAPQVDSPTVTEFTAILRRELEQLKPTQPALAATPPAIQQTSGGPKALAVPTFAAPVFDDDDAGDTIILRKDTSTDSGLNFVTSMLNLIQ
jgi:hypothetical protein